MRHGVGECPRRSLQHTQYEAQGAFGARHEFAVNVGLSKWADRVTENSLYKKTPLHWRRKDIIQLTDLYKENKYLWLNIANIKI